MKRYCFRIPDSQTIALDHVWIYFIKKIWLPLLWRPGISQILGSKKCENHKKWSPPFEMDSLDGIKHAIVCAPTDCDTMTCLNSSEYFLEIHISGLVLARVRDQKCLKYSKQWKSVKPI